MQNSRKALSIALLFVASGCYADDAVSQTFFTARQNFQDDMPAKRSLFRNPRMWEREDGLGGAIEVVGYYSQSIESEDLGKFFMPYGKCNLVVEETKTTDAASTEDGRPGVDIEARNFNISTTHDTAQAFKSTINIRPSQKVGGIGVVWKQNWWTCAHNRSHIWTEVSVPVEHVENKVVLNEHVDQTGGGTDGLPGLDGTTHVSNMKEAFKQAGWKYGRIDGCSHAKWGVADVEVKLGYAVSVGDCCILSSFAGFVAPTGTKIDQRVARNIFAPVVGNNHHWGVMFGSEGIIELWESENGNHQFRMAHNISSRFLFTNTQFRVFDLVDKQWGRYLETYNAIGQAALANAASDPANANMGTSGINVFATWAKVEPRYIVDLNSAFIYNYKGLNIELGYNFFAREAEKVSVCKWDDDAIAIKDVAGDGNTTLARTITNNFAGADFAYPTYKAVTRCMLNPESASHPAVLSNILYGAIGGDWSCRIPMFAAVGGSYEFSKVNTAINRWQVFAKYGLSF